MATERQPEDTYLVRFPNTFRLYDVFKFASDHGHQIRWKMPKDNRSKSLYEVLLPANPDITEPADDMVEPDTGETM